MTAVPSSIWKDRRFFLYTIGLMINSFGQALYMVALPLLVYSITQSVAAMSIMAIAETFPRVIASFFIGSIVDRVSRRVVIFAALGFQAVCSFLIAILFAGDRLPIELLYVLGALVAIGHETARTAEFAIIPAMFKERRMEANAGLQAAHTLMMITGPLVAGLALVAFDYGTLLWFNAITYLGPIILCIWTRIPHETQLGGIRNAKQMATDAYDGFKYLFRDRILAHLLLITIIAGVADSGLLTIVLFYLKNDLAVSDQFISVVFTIDGIGLFLGSLLLPRLKGTAQGKLMFYGLLVNNIGMLILIVPSALVVPVALFLIAVGSVVFIVSKNVITQEVVPNEMLGRIGGSMRMVGSLSTSISTVILGAVTSFGGAPTAFLFATVLSFIPSFMIWKSPLYRYDTPRAAGEEAA